MKIWSSCVWCLKFHHLAEIVGLRFVQVLHVPQLTALTHWDWNTIETTVSNVLRPSYKLKEAKLISCVSMQTHLSHDFGGLKKLELCAMESLCDEQDVKPLSRLNLLQYLTIDDYAPKQGSVLSAFTVLQRSASALWCNALPCKCFSMQSPSTCVWKNRLICCLVF